VRCDNKNNLQDSAPCERCLETIIYLDIKRIVFSSRNNTFISANPCELTINHISAGSKFLTKRLKNNNTNNKENNNVININININ
tara:strand:+ start:1601 stop:1855 length:255 start_codon:yes stop_codon:yes gene_type:complete